MNRLNIFVERNGNSAYVGNIFYENTADAVFQYADSYLISEGAAPISVSLPLQKEAFSPQETKKYFDGLLPEGFTRRSVAQQMRVNEDDYLSILSGLGCECLGAVRVSADDEIRREASYDLLTEAQVAAFAREGATKSAELVTKSHLSLTGASGKAGLYFDRKNNAWYLPLGEAPSTHIVKQSHVRLSGIVTNEQLCLLTARKLGIDVPDSFIINVGNASEGEVLFATARYDRVLNTEQKINGLYRPLRLHQEDFAQALGISSADKYEPENGNYAQKAFRLLAAYSSNPLVDQMKLWDILVFDYLVGNTDNHIKNLSLLYGSNLKNIRLAPAYDILSTAVYESSTRDMAISIGGRINLDEIDREAFREEAVHIGFGTRMAMKRFDTIKEGFESALRQSAEELMEAGFCQAKELQERILERGTKRGTAMLLDS